jgi:hypothetical protein
VGGFRRRHDDELVESVEDGSSATRLSSLSPSLIQDLTRFSQDGRPADLLEVLAASLRHGRNVTAHLQHADRTMSLTTFPLLQLAYCPLELLALLKNRLESLTVTQVEPAVVRPPGDADESRVGKPHLYRPLSHLLWAVALYGPRIELLPELTGAAVYRVSPIFDLAMLSEEGPIREALLKLIGDIASLREIASWPGMSREHAIRLLNALYLQSGLIVSRSHPAALSDSWFSALAA